MSRSDEQLVAAAQTGSLAARDQLLRRYTGFAYSLARPYSSPRSDTDDLRQEALLGLIAAIHAWRPDGGRNFPSFAALTIRRRLFTVLKTDNTIGRRPPVPPVSLHDLIDTGDSDDLTLEAVLADPHAPDPARLHLLRAELATVVRVVRDELSPLERAVFTAWVNGDTYMDTARQLGLSYTLRPERRQSRSKAVDNALQRARAKLLRALTDDGFGLAA